MPWTRAAHQRDPLRYRRGGQRLAGLLVGPAADQHAGARGAGGRAEAGAGLRVTDSSGRVPVRLGEQPLARCADRIPYRRPANVVTRELKSSSSSSCRLRLGWRTSTAAPWTASSRRSHQPEPGQAILVRRRTTVTSRQRPPQQLLQARAVPAGRTPGPRTPTPPPGGGSAQLGLCASATICSWCLRPHVQALQRGLPRSGTGNLHRADVIAGETALAPCQVSGTFPRPPQPQRHRVHPAYRRRDSSGSCHAAPSSVFIPGTAGNMVAAGQGEAPGGDVEPNGGGHGAGDGVIDVGQQIAVSSLTLMPHSRASSHQSSTSCSTG